MALGDFLRFKAARIGKCRLRQSVRLQITLENRKIITIKKIKSHYARRRKRKTIGGTS